MRPRHVVCLRKPTASMRHRNLAVNIGLINASKVATSILKTKSAPEDRKTIDRKTITRVTRRFSWFRSREQTRQRDGRARVHDFRHIYTVRNITFAIIYKPFPARNFDAVPSRRGPTALRYYYYYNVAGGFGVRIISAVASFRNTKCCTRRENHQIERSAQIFEHREQYSAHARNSNLWRILVRRNRFGNNLTGSYRRGFFPSRRVIIIRLSISYVLNA